MILFRDMRPKIECILEKNQEACLKSLKEDNTDLLIVAGGSVLRAVKEYNAKPILAETYGEGSTKLGERPAIALIKEGSTIKTLSKYRRSYFDHGRGRASRS